MCRVKASHWQRGESLDYVNETEEMIEAGSEVYFRTAAMVSKMGKIATASAVGTYNSTVKDQLEKMEVLAIPSANGTVNGTVKDCIRAGYATQDAEAGVGTVFVKINA